ncbi:nuclear pore complex protein Nup153 isoform X1 [Aedes albopictus]|uniref:Nuclear pore complex protein Nup153 n=1 Tax=Aedes albopictus TaxID=7160 RepID=A0ABM1Z185_AEDAL|nr:nuclear pore complex protein Nup153-like isoform X1 [Aedes albopictus]
MFQAHSRITRSNEASPSSSPMAAAAAASGAALNTSTDSNLDDDPNSSIMNKVRSRVSSILPDALSKWFSPAKRPRDTGSGSNEPNNSGGSGSPTGRNGNLLRRENRLRQFGFGESELADAERQQQQRNQYDPEDDDGEEEEDEDHAPPIRKKKRMEEGFNATEVDFNEDLSAVPGPSGLNISAIDRRSSLPAAASGIHLPQYYRNAFSSSTPSTSPQQQQQQQQQALNRPLQRTSLIGHTNRVTAPYNFGVSGGLPIAEEQEANESLSVSIRQRKGIREISSRKRLNIPPMPVDRSTSEPPAPIFGRRFPLQMQQQQLQEEGSSEELREEGNLLSNGNLNESASESSSVSNLNLSQTEGHPDTGRRLSGFMGNSRSKRSRVGGSTGDLCFSSHLETEKSLFALKNSGQSGRPAFNASLYGSTTSLGSSNSSLFANSPFYNGRTMYGGASAYSSRRDARQKALRVPVQIRPSSSLSNFSSSNTSLASDTSALSNTAKRILEILNQRSGPLTEARKLGSSLSLNSTLSSSKVPGLVQARKRFNEEDLSMNRSIRMSSPRTPYSRPMSATGSSSSSINKPLSTELQIPTMSQLLQMKRLQTNTESARRMATESSGSTILNEPTQYKLPSAESDDTNNNVKHTSKMRNKLHRIREESHTERGSNAPVPQVNLPEVQLAGLKSVPKFDIQLPVSKAVETGDKPKTVAPKATNNNNNNVYKFSSPTKLDVAGAGSSTASKSRNNFKFSDPEPLRDGKSNSSSSSSTPAPPSLKLGGFQFNPELAKPKAAVPASQSSPVKAPLPLKSGSCLDALKGSSAVPELKTGSCLDVLSKPVALAPLGNGSASGFGSAFKLTGSNKWECDTCMVRNDQDKTKCVSCETPKPGSKPEATPAKSSFSFGSAPTPAAVSTDSGFKALVAQQSAKWECSDCMTRNDSDKLKCVCCEKAKPGAAAASTPAAVPAAIKSMFSMPVSSSSSDQGFKALVAQQSANKWECSACMTRNEASRSKCACCEQAKPGSTPEDAPTFSFGSTPASSSSGAKFSFGVPPSSDAAPKTGFSFGVPPANSTASAPASASTGFTFGSVTSTTNTTNSEDKPKFSFGSGTSAAKIATPASGSGFSFGIKPAATSDTTDSPKPTEKAESPKPAPTGGFSFGSKPASSAASKTSEAVTSTTTTSGFSFGSPSSKPAEAPKTVGFSFGKPAETTNAVSATASLIAKPTTSSSDAATEQQKKPTVSFGSLAAGATTTASSSSFGASSAASPASSFSFGSAATKSTESKPTPIVGSGMFSFGSQKSAASSSTSTVAPTAESKPTGFSTGAAIAAAASNVPIFGGAQKPAGPSITPTFSFGAASGSTAASTTASSSPAASTFSFGSTSSKPAETSTTTSTVTASTPAAPSFVFGQSGQSASKVMPIFGTAAAAATAAPSSDKPTFGTFGAAAAAAPATNTGTSSTGIFGSSTTTGSSGFGFTAAAASATTPKPAESSTSSSAFTFGASKSNSSLASGAAPVFGSPAAASASTPIFGSPSTNTPTFGSFGAAAGSSGTSAPAFGSSTFGAASSPARTGSTTGSIFGQQSTAAGATAPAFGSASSASTTAPVFGAATPAFGASSPFAAPTGDEPQAKKLFEFGSGSATANSAPAAAPFQFGSSSNNNNNNDNTAKPFSFSANSAPSFNFTAGSNVGQTSAPFTFGSSQPVAPVASGGMFSFGAATGAGPAGAPAPLGSGLGGMADRHKYTWSNAAAGRPEENPRHKTYHATVGARRPPQAAAASKNAANPTVTTTRTKHPNLVWTKDGQNSNSISSSSNNPTRTTTTIMTSTNNNNSNTAGTAEVMLPPPPPPPGSQNYDKSRFRYVSPELKRKMTSTSGTRQSEPEREPDHTMS